MRERNRQPVQPPVEARILEIAEEHIRRHGIERTTVIRIAEAAGMSHANVYRYYPSKSALIDEITAHWLKGLEVGIRVIVEAPDPAFDKLERILFGIHRAYRDKLEQDPAIFDLFARASAEGHGVARKHRNRLQLEIQRTLEEGVASHVFNIQDQRQALALIFDAMHRFIHPLAVKLDSDAPRTILEARAGNVAALVLRALQSGRYS
jgi:AcrR family transcriptional regulator